MSRGIKDWVNSCEKRAAKRKHSQKHVHLLQTRKPSHPFWQVALDIIRLVPESVGLKYILLIGDHFPKWYKVVPLQNQKAERVAKIFIDNRISRYGWPSNLLSDKLSNFIITISKFCVANKK